MLNKNAAATRTTTLSSYHLPQWRCIIEPLAVALTLE